MTLNVGVLVGSLRRDSYTRRIANAAMELAPDTLEFGLVEIGDLPLYNEDLDSGAPPETWRRFRDEIGPLDGILFFTPEYNRSIPGCLKNAIDVGSRPGGKSVWTGKPAAIAGVTPYRLGAFGATLAVRQCLIFLDMPTLQAPEVYIGEAADLLGEDGKLADPQTAKLLARFMKAFAEFTGKLRSAGDRFAE